MSRIDEWNGIAPKRSKNATAIAGLKRKIGDENADPVGYPGDAAPDHILRRCLSAPNMGPNVIGKINPGLVLVSEVRTFGSLRLSTPDKMISPVPLSRPTHSLVVVEDSGTFLEMPINAVNFLVSCPNIAQPEIFPHRLSQHLTRVVIEVPRLLMFRELVQYMHTMNNAALFRAAIPALWIRDALTPLPIVIAPAPKKPIVVVEAPKIPKLFSRKRTRSLFSLRAPKVVTPPFVASELPPAPSSGRTVESVAQEIADADAASSADANNSDLLTAVDRLGALKDHLIDIGFYGKDVWEELDRTLQVLLLAVSCRPKVAAVENLMEDVTCAETPMVPIITVMN